MQLSQKSFAVFCLSCIVAYKKVLSLVENHTSLQRLERISIVAKNDRDDQCFLTNLNILPTIGLSCQFCIMVRVGGFKLPQIGNRIETPF